MVPGKPDLLQPSWLRVAGILWISPRDTVEVGSRLVDRERVPRIGNVRIQGPVVKLERWCGEMERIPEREAGKADSEFEVSGDVGDGSCDNGGAAQRYEPE